MSQAPALNLAIDSTELPRPIHRFALTVPLTADWHRPVAAILDALGLDYVTPIGGSLGGCFAIPTAAFESRVRRVVAYDVMTDFHE